MDHQLPLTTAEQMISQLKNPEFTAEDDQKIIDLFNTGHSMGFISNQFKNRSRSAIAGRITRLRNKLNESGLKPVRGRTPKIRVKAVNTPSKPRLIASLPPTEIQPSVTTKDELPPPQKRMRLRMVDTDTTEVTLQELELHHCKWPKGDPRHSDFRFCGAPRISESERTPYCKEHTLLAGRQY